MAVPLAIFAPRLLPVAGIGSLAIAAYLFLRPPDPDDLFGDDWAEAAEASVVMVATAAGLACMVAGIVLWISA